MWTLKIYRHTHTVGVNRAGRLAPSCHCYSKLRHSTTHFPPNNYPPDCVCVCVHASSRGQEVIGKQKEKDDGSKLWHSGSFQQPWRFEHKQEVKTCFMIQFHTVGRADCTHLDVLFYTWMLPVWCSVWRKLQLSTVNRSMSPVLKSVLSTQAE